LLESPQELTEDMLESEHGLNVGSDDTAYPQATVKLSKAQYSIFELKRKNENEKRREIILNPDFQRHQVWKKVKQKSELVESILMDIPLPLIYLFEKKDGCKEVVDGRQRLSTLFDYLNGTFALGELQILRELNGKKFEHLDPMLQSKLEDHQIMAYIIQPPTPERIKFDIFDRVNRGGTQLNNQEMRNALYQGHATRLLNECASSEDFIKATGGAIKSDRMKDRYLVLRFLGFYLWRTTRLEIEYKSHIDEFLAAVMQHLNDAQQFEELAFLEEAFTKAMKYSYNLFGSDGFRFETQHTNRRPINMPLFEALAYGFAIWQGEDSQKVSLKKLIIELKEEFDNHEYFSKSVDSSVSVKYRFERVEQVLGEGLND
jgi:hypothetical protein